MTAFGRDSGWVLIESHESDGVEWGISLDGGWDPTPERYLRCGSRASALLWLACLRLGLGGRVGRV